MAKNSPIDVGRNEPDEGRRPRGLSALRRAKVGALLIIALLVSLPGCGAYSVAIRNHTDRLIVDSSAILNGEETVTGVLGKGGGKLHGLFARKVPKEAEVRWVWEGDTEKRVHVSLTGTVPRGFRGDIVFVINADATVSVHTRK